MCGKEGHVAKNYCHCKNKDNEQEVVNVTIARTAMRPDLQGMVIYNLFL